MRNPPARFLGDPVKFTGSYTGRGRGEDLLAKISKNAVNLEVSFKNQKPRQLTYVKEYMWTDGIANYIFKLKNGQVTELRIDQAYGYFVLKRQA